MLVYMNLHVLYEYMNYIQNLHVCRLVVLPATNSELLQNPELFQYNQFY